MLKYIVKRIGMALATLLVIIFVLFVLVRIMPGNPFPSERMSATQIWCWTIPFCFSLGGI